MTDLAALLDITPFLTPHSDIVALMVLEHQVVMHNAITAANYSARITHRDARIMNEALQRDADYESDSTQRRYDSAAEKVLDILLMVDDCRLTDPIAGTSNFAQEFQKRGPFDRQGRSLRELDLQTRLFKYPCSYLIYTDSFDALPSAVRDRVLRQLRKILRGEKTSDKYRHLSHDDRQAILEIVTDTKSNLTDEWKMLP